MLIDDDSGIGTQFEVADINGDGLLDIIVVEQEGRARDRAGTDCIHGVEINDA